MISKKYSMGTEKFFSERHVKDLRKIFIVLELCTYLTMVYIRTTPFSSNYSAVSFRIKDKYA